MRLVAGEDFHASVHLGLYGFYLLNILDIQIADLLFGVSQRAVVLQRNHTIVALAEIVASGNGISLGII